VTDHILLDVDRDEFLAIVNGDCVADHLGQNCRPARPGLMHPLLGRLIHLANRLNQVVVYKRPLLD